MDLETLSGLQGLGGTGLAAVALWQLSKFLTVATRFLERVELHLEAQKDHRRDERAHQGRLEQLLTVVRVPNPAQHPQTARDAPVRAERQIAVESG